MRYGQIRPIDVGNGEGIRVTLFTTGCYFNCYNCFNQEYQDFNHGNKFTEQDLKDIINYLDKDYIKGLSLLGGEPMEYPNELLDITEEVRKHLRADQDIWLWSGYTLEEIILDKDKLNLLKQIDVLVDGLYQDEKKDLNLKFRGSSNQRVIDVQKTLKKGYISFKYGKRDI